MKNRFFHKIMASSSSHTNNGIPLATLLEWYKIRDTFFGHNCVDQNIPLAIELAASCDHPDARWLIEACAGKDVSTWEDAERVFSPLGQNDAHALCFAWLCGDRRDLSPLRRSAELGFPFAQALLAAELRGQDSFKLAQLAAAQQERDAFFWQAYGLSDDLTARKQSLLMGGRLGCVPCMSRLGWMLGEWGESRQKWEWWGRGAQLGDVENFLANFPEEVDLFAAGHGSAAVMFAIGRALHGHVDEEGRKIFNKVQDFDSLIRPARRALAFYDMQLKATRKAIDTWVIIGKRLGVVKDVRRIIALLIWNGRADASFSVVLETNGGEARIDHGSWCSLM
jgi:hypothetical protein